MYNDFFMYLSEKLNEYFIENNLNAGETYYVQMDDCNLINDLFNEISGLSNKQDFEENAFGRTYKSVELLYENASLIIASSNDAKDGNLVFLRNAVKEQRGKYKGKSILFIINNYDLDSITNDGANLLEKGMPFNPEELSEELHETLKTSSMSDMDKEVVAFDIEAKENGGYEEHSLFEFADDYALIKKGVIQEEDYVVLGLFRDSNLNQFIGNAQDRLQQNHDFFEMVQKAHDLNLRDELLSEKFDDGGVKKLSKTDWKKCDYKDVKHSFDKNKKNKILVLEKVTVDGLDYYEKFMSETAAGRRKRSIIIFNPEELDKVFMRMKFDNNAPVCFFSKMLGNAEVINQGQTLRIELKPIYGSLSFYAFKYSYEGQSKSTYTIELCICPFSKELLPIQNNQWVKAKDNTIRLSVNDENGITFGAVNNSIELFEINDNDQLDADNNRIKISTKVIESLDKDISINMRLGGCMIKLLFANDGQKPVPIQISKIEQLKRNYCDSFIQAEKTLSIGGSTYYYGVDNSFEGNIGSVSDRIKLEKEIINKQVLFGSVNSNGIVKDNIKINPNIINAYLEILKYYQDRDSCPLLEYFDSEQAGLYKKYIDLYFDELKDIRDDVLPPNRKELLLLGTVRNADEYLVSPFNIINVTYRYTMYLANGEESLSVALLNRLDSSSLVPYLYIPTDSKLYRSAPAYGGGYWIRFVDNQSETSTAVDKYLADLISTKLQQFIKYYALLFNYADAPILINAINLSTNVEFVKGILRFEKKEIKRTGRAVPLIVTFYHEKNIAAVGFEQLFRIENPDIINNKYGNILKDFGIEEAKDTLKAIKKAISYYVCEDNKKYNYAHITFCNNNSLDSAASHNMSDLPTGLGLDGIVGGVSSIMTTDYRLGFGSKNLSNSSLLNQMAVLLNEYAYNMVNYAQNTYLRGKSIVSVSSIIALDKLQAMYDSSYWVTFINPKFSLDYFLEQSQDLLIVHYGDQLESSDTYTAITVTQKTDLYKSIMTQYLGENGVPVNEDSIEDAIKLFNSINGEWLLKLVESGNRYSSRSNISHVAAVKYMTAFLANSNFIWIPVSMEEILRVAGTMRLNMETVFSKDDLGIEGPASDDILLIGIEKTNPIRIHFYPVEVKVSKNDISSINKGKTQIANVYKVYENNLFNIGEDTFIKKFYRNFFMQILQINVNKLYVNGFLPNDDYNYILSIKEALLNDKFHVSTAMRKYIGKGAVLCFKSDNSWKSANLDDGIMIIQLNKDDAFTGVVESIDEITDKIQNGKTDLDTAMLISNIYKSEEIVEENEKHCNYVGDSLAEVSVDSEEYYTSASNEEVQDISINATLAEPKEDIMESNSKELIMNPVEDINDIRILIGNVHGTKKKIYWEYGNNQLANRHLLILGKSGQGKSYLIQCLLLELSKRRISSLIIDYTDGFKKSQLEEVFKQSLGDKLQQFTVAKNKFPLNPFKKNMKEIDEGEYIEEDASDVADRVSSILDSIYGFGDQQSNTIYQAVKIGVDKYGEKMNLSRLKEILGEDESTYARTVTSRLALLFDKNPFSYDGEFDWNTIEDEKGKVYIIQLTGFMKDIQRVVTEFILWDLWYHRLEKGTKNNPLPVILDEAQNLNHNDKSPSAKILTEGRKFGWSGWYATQFLKGALGADEVKRLENSGHKVFFMPPDSEISQVASMLTKDNSERKSWESRLTSLVKGQCISYGLLVDENGIERGDIAAIVDITSLEERT